MKKGLLSLLILIATFAGANEIKSVNFFQQGELSKLVIELDSPAQAERFSIKEDKQIILDVKDVGAAPGILRGIDTSEFPGATVYISGYKKPGTANDMRFAIQLRDNVRSVLSKSENKLVLNIENRFGALASSSMDQRSNTTPQLSASSESTFSEQSSGSQLHIPKSGETVDILENMTLAGRKRYLGKKININVNDMGVPTILEIIADASGFNVIIDDEVSKRKPMTLKLVGSPWDQVLDTVMDLNKLVAKKHGNILSITTKEKAELEFLAESKREEATKAQEPLVSSIFPISFAKLADMENIAKAYLTPSRGTIQKDERTNYLIVQDTADVLAKIKRIVRELDKPTPQVMIEGKIVELVDEHSIDIGLVGAGDNSPAFNFNYNGSYNYNGDTAYTKASNLAYTLSSAGGLVSPTFVVGKLLNLSANLRLLEQEEKAKIVSSPKVITKHKETANLTSGETTYVSGVTTVGEGGGTAAATYTPLTANIDLSVTPQVTNEGSVNLEVNLSKKQFRSSLATGGAPPPSDDHTIKTNVLVDNGDTLMIGGLYQETNTKGHAGVPGLKDIPIIGWLFRTSYNPKERKRELVIFITPTILEGSSVQRRNAAGEFSQ